jgi:hypothetical protein
VQGRFSFCSLNSDHWLRVDCGWRGAVCLVVGLDGGGSGVDNLGSVSVLEVRVEH